MTTKFRSLAYSLLIFILFGGITTVQAQVRDEEPMHRFPLFRDVHFETGINIVPLARAIKGNAGDSVQSSPYWLNGRLSWRNWGIRGSAGGSFSEKNTFVQGFKDSDKRTNTQFNLRAGVDYRIKWKNRYTFTIGADWARHLNESIRVLDSGFDVIEQISQQETKGGGLSLGGQCWLNHHFGIGLESSFYYMTGQLTEGRTFVNFPELDDDINQSDFRELITPVGLFVIWKF